jgi:hypothetical protein
LRYNPPAKQEKRKLHKKNFELRYNTPAKQAFIAAAAPEDEVSPAKDAARARSNDIGDAPETRERARTRPPVAPARPQQVPPVQLLPLQVYIYI